MKSGVTSMNKSRRPLCLQDAETHRTGQNSETPPEPLFCLYLCVYIP